MLFTTFVSMAQGGEVRLTDFINIPVSILLGILLGAAAGILLSLLFETAYRRGRCIRNSMKVIVILGVAFLLIAVEGWLDGIVSVSGLLSVAVLAILITAPLGALGMDASYKRLLVKEKDKDF